MYTLENKSYHICRRLPGWVFKEVGSVSVNDTNTFPKKSQAVNFGKKLCKAQKTDLYIHKPNGMVEKKYSFSGT